MGKYFFSETEIRSSWEQVLAAFWQRYPNPYSTHVLTEDVIFREVTPDNCLLSRRLLTKTNRLPRWAERIFPGNLSRSVYIVEDSIIDPSSRRLTTLTWNLNHSTLMTVVERCVFHSDQERPVWTGLTREAWISSGVFGLSRPIQEFGLSKFRSNQMKAIKGLEHALSKLQMERPLYTSAPCERAVTMETITYQNEHININLSYCQSCCYRKLIDSF
ncbi:PRELI domain containing 1b isoform X3 [Ictalurus furcatus]|uniref:PRELI domain containing 1b isoform X3 n=1 Tax=Ictalurus furcatus TaxID=66913 RepID=UPI002350ADB9|nr:PRELI domain containing 1b isoform X3 [Ictalurus furcatus]XP_053498544.1 PRELI domain containing 1b isoform X3 [Ictalurus furcatus]